MKKFLAHQGDVLVMAAAIPESAQPVETNGTTVLAYGESTGHSHHIIGGGITMFRDDGGAGGTYLRVTEPKSLEHGAIGRPGTADHDAISLVPQDYEVLRQVEWSDDQEPIQVAD